MALLTFALLNLDESTQDLRSVFILLIGLCGIGAVVAAVRGHIKAGAMTLVGVVIALMIVWIQGNPDALNGSVGEFVSSLFGG